MPRQVNSATVQLVKHFESLYLEAYLCPAKVWTIGYGHTGLVHNDGTVKAGLVITAAKAEELLARDLTIFSAGVEKLLLSRPREELNDCMFGALTSFAFNVGLEALKNSTLLRRINARQYADAVPEFLKWVYADGRVLRGLTRRRKSEAALFCSFPNPIVPA